MSLMRRCGACLKGIEQEQYLELTLRVLKSEEEPAQNPVEQAYDDYCDACIASGAAVRDLLGCLATYPKEYDK